MLEIAEEFGRSLDRDEFERTAKTLSDSCVYVIGEMTLKGPKEICDSYEQNMIEGRKKLDKLVWGDARIEELGGGQYFVHFTDYLGHAGEEYTHRCKQKLSIEENLIVKIEHMDDPEEQERLNAWYRKVGLK